MYKVVGVYCVLLRVHASYAVTTVSGQLTPAASLAHDICTRCSKDHMIIHVAQQQRSYQAQQAMVLVDIFNSKSKSSMQQQVGAQHECEVVL